MNFKDTSARVKSLEINLDPTIYGTFAEIGAGQEVARHFFQAGKASQTVAKTISAYDMTFSDEIYGKSGRYVCQERLGKMLDHEFRLLEERLQPHRGQDTRFFVFADTVATHSDDVRGKSQGWMGIRFQSRPLGPVNEIRLHVKMWDRFRLQQQEALGLLGVNLIHMAFFPPEDTRLRISALLENLSPQRIEVDMIRFSGPDLESIDDRLMSLELVNQQLTDAVLFDDHGEPLQASDALFHQPVFVMRGTFRPVTSTNMEILEHGLEQFKKEFGLKETPQVLFEITMNNLRQDGKLDFVDFLQRVDALNTLGHKVLISNFYLFYQIKSYLRQNTDRPVGMALGASHLERMFEAEHYQSLPGGILEGMSRLFDDQTRMFVFPYKAEKVCLTADTLQPAAKYEHLYKHLLQNGLIKNMVGCDDIDTSVHSRDVRRMMASGDKKWKDLVPEPVRKIIEQRKFFGLKT